MNTTALTCTVIATPLGRLYALAVPEAVTGLYFEGQKYFPTALPPTAVASPLLARLTQELDVYFSGTPVAFTGPFQPVGTPFQQRVWQALLHIPAGTTRSYGELAAHLGQASAARAVAAAIGRNPLSVVVPCHRVVGRDGSLTGYAGGLARKAALLALEQSLKKTSE